ncbi:MAG TPA: ubiquitin-like small modifier protein 1 [Actinomycetota bacterium]|nr:ubiquitin-like small modifier protein 1 [Actinomycetota bacterium]
MGVIVKLPTQLRPLAGDRAEVQASGETVGQVIDDLEAQHPGLRERLLDESGSIRRFVNIYVDDEDVRFLKGLESSLPEGASISIIPAVAGGSGVR